MVAAAAQWIPEEYDEVNAAMADGGTGKELSLVKCKREWWNDLKLGIDTTLDLEDIRHKRPQLKPFVTRPRAGR